MLFVAIFLLVAVVWIYFSLKSAAKTIRTVKAQRKR